MRRLGLQFLWSDATMVDYVNITIVHAAVAD